MLVRKNMETYRSVKLELLLVWALLWIGCDSWSCGSVRGKATLDRIVGGYTVGYYKYPWFAGLVVNDFVVCGGTLIAPGYVVTAAHCYKEFVHSKTSLEDAYQVKLGMSNRCQQEKTQKTYKVKKAFMHEEYMERDPYFDIMLLQLDGDTSDFMPVCAPKRALTTETRGKEGLIAGLGVLKYHGKTPCTMREARVKIYPDPDCRKMLDEADHTGKDLINAFCAGYLEGGIDACQGDSGGPLMITGSHGEHILLGITSFGYECAAKDVLGMYTDVSHYLDWLDKKMTVKLANSTPIITPVSEKPAPPTSNRPPANQTTFPWHEGPTGTESQDDGHHHIVVPMDGRPFNIIIHIPKRKYHRRNLEGNFTKGAQDRKSLPKWHKERKSHKKKNKKGGKKRKEH